MTLKDKTIGLVWLTPVLSDLRVSEMHLCSPKEYHGKWLSKDVVDEGLRWLDETGEFTVACHSDPHYKRMLSRLGFDVSAPHINVRKRRD